MLIPDAVYVINFNLIVPQTDTLLVDTEITMDEWPIILGAYAKAIGERGEDAGRTELDAVAQYKVAVSDAIALDVARTDGEDMWHV